MWGCDSNYQCTRMVLLLTMLRRDVCNSIDRTVKHYAVGTVDKMLNYFIFIYCLYKVY